MAYFGTPTAASNFTTYYSTDDDHAYSQTQFEPSPLNRLIKRASPGDSWYLGTGKEVKQDTDSNIANVMMKYTVQQFLLFSLTAAVWQYAFS